jgi:2-oxoisovalerate dehydrogenase E1 component
MVEVPFGQGSEEERIDYCNLRKYNICIQAADQIVKESGKQLEVIDIRSLIPLDKEAILASVRKTGKVIVIHEDKVFAGFGAEIAAMIAGEAFEFLDAPVKRVGSTFTPVGFNRILEKAILPNTDKIYEACKEILAY